jgi:hypothetical protein
MHSACLRQARKLINFILIFKIMEKSFALRTGMHGGKFNKHILNNWGLISIPDLVFYSTFESSALEIKNEIPGIKVCIKVE